MTTTPWIITPTAITHTPTGLRFTVEAWWMRHKGGDRP